MNPPKLFSQKRNTFFSVQPSKVCIAIAFVFSLQFDGGAQDLKHFNPSVFGQAVGSNFRLLLDSADGVDPSLIQLDFEHGKCYAATVRYSTKITLQEARRSLNRLYGKWQKPNFAEDKEMGLWRNDDAHFSIQLTKEKDEIVIIYVSRLLREQIGGKQ